MTESAQNSARILIVDDSPDDRLLLQRLLSKTVPAETRLADSAKEAFRMLGIDDPQQGDPQTDLILVDIVMPEINGIEACRRLKSDPRLQNVLIIMITAETVDERLAEAFAAGAMDYITKPLKAVELHARVGSALRLKQSMDTCRMQGQVLLKKNKELERALQEIKVLRGLIPICATCKKVRNETGAWQNLEAYVTEHSGALFSHGICADCLARDYPEFEKG